MFDLRKAKIGLFDFDCTLCVHADKLCVDDPDTNEDVLLGGLPWDRQPTFKKSTVMQQFITYLQHQNKSLYMCSASHYFPQLDAKCRWASTEYSAEFTNVSVSVQNDKADMCEFLSKALSINSEEILFVDGNCDVLRSLQSKGFQTMGTLEVADWVFDHIATEQAAAV